jgi:hypothetical protein
VPGRVLWRFAVVAGGHSGIATSIRTMDPSLALFCLPRGEASRASVCVRFKEHVRMLKSVLVALVVVCPLLVAQEKDAAIGSFGFHTGPHAPGSPARDLDWSKQAAAAAHHDASRAWRAEHPGWSVLFDLRTGLPWRAFGPGIPVASHDAAKSEIESVSLGLKESLAKAAGLDPADFVFVIAAGGDPIWYVDFEQRIGGVPVTNCALTLRIDRSGRLVMWGGRFVDPKNVNATPTLRSEDAISSALSHLAVEKFLTGATAVDPPTAKLVMHVADEADSFLPRLSWLVETHTEEPMAVWKIFVDAVTGDVIQYWNTICESHGHDHEGDEPFVERSSPLFMEPLLASFGGVANGTVHDGVPPQGAPVLRNIRDLYVNCNGTNVTTDQFGAYTFTGGGASVPVTSVMSGPHSTVRNYNNTTGGPSGPQPNFSATGTSGTLDIVWTDLNSSIEARDAFYFTNIAWNNLILHNPTETLFNNAINTNVNYSTSTCNAFYTTSPLSINFYSAGGGCINTATEASIPIHEYGHHVTVQTYLAHSQSVPGSLQEGFSDCQAASYLDSNLIGANWQGPGTAIRNLNNTCQYPSSCGTQVHSWGLVIGGCYWHTRIQFANAYGAAGKAMLDGYLYKHFHATPDDQVDVLVEWLLLNDTDANLANGTPDADKFYQGFTVQHSVPFPIPLMSIGHAPIADTMDQLQAYQIHATAAPSGVFPGATITSGQVFYSVSGSAYSSVPMSLSGSEYVGLIPVQGPGKIISYYLQFTDSAAHSEKLPSGGALSPFSFKTFRTQTFTPFFTDDFEVASGWTSAQVAGQNDWQNNVMGNPNHAWDPPSAYSGTRVWGNDLSPSGFNGNYGNNVNNNLTSPTLNCTGQSNVSLVFHRWLTVEDGAFDHARIRVSNNNGVSYTTVWENPAGSGTQHFIDTAWTQHSVNISGLADNQAQVRVRFELVSDGGLVFGGWNVDAFSLANSATPLIVTNEGSNAPFGAGVIRVSGISGDGIILAADVVSGPVFYSGIGTISLDAASPTLLILFNGQTVPPAGFLDYTFTVPNASGVTGWFQGALFPQGGTPPIVLTNVVPFTIQ